MANYIKRLRGYIATLLIIYTVLVTYFLAQSAWDADVNNKSRRNNNFNFLNVLVQEERRHLRNFQDVVQNYRGVVQIHIGDKGGNQKDYGQQNTSDNLGGAFQDKIGQDSKPHKTYLFGQDNPNETAYNDTYLDNDIQIPLHQGQGKVRAARKPTFQVEVEEWDANAVHTKPRGKDQPQNYQREKSYSVNSLHFQQQNPEHKNSVLVKSNLNQKDGQNPSKQQGKKNVTTQALYSTEFCDTENDDSDMSPEICLRELAEFGREKHVNISTFSSLFRAIGDIYVYSAFLDLRKKPFSIRLMALGSEGRGNSNSAFKCVFSIPADVSYPKDNYNRPNLINKSTHKVSTQLTYYTASDGHKKTHQFYIMSCPVPEQALNSFLHLGTELIQIVVGGQGAQSADTVQESMTVAVVINSLLGLTDISGLHQSMSDRSSHNLLKRNIDSLESESMLHLSNSIDGNINKDKNNNTIKPVIQKDSKPVRSVAMSASSEDKIVACVAPLHGTIGVIQMVEFIELTFLLGTQHIVFYTFRVFDDIRKVLNIYQTRGLITVLPWNIPAPNSVWAKGRDIALNDCLYRTMHLYDYALFLDLDEFFVPRATPDLPSFLKYLKTKHSFNATRFSDLVFSSAYFPPPSKLQYKNLTTATDFSRDVNKFASLKSVHRTYFNQQHTLRMVKQSKAFRVGAGERKKTSFTLSPRYAAVNHYSYCPKDPVPVQTNHINPNDNSDKNLEQISKDVLGIKTSFVIGGIPQTANKKDTAAGPASTATNICSHTKVDWVMWKYKPYLVERTKETVRKLNGG